MKKNIEETTSSGAISSHSIAGSLSGGYDGNDSVNLKDFMSKFFASTKSRPNFQEVKTKPKSYKKISESDDTLNNVFSQLRNSEQKSHDSKSSSTFGVEDDNGNIMKITVPSEQSEDFEVKLSKELAEIEDFKATGHRGKDMSMAELLYTLKDEFNVLDVDFPTIPNDVIYNADKATTNVDDFDSGDDMGEGGDEPIGSPDGIDDEVGNDIGDEVEGDAENVEDFDDEVSDNNPESILAAVMDMLKANAEAEKAKAEAEAEKARAKQAEYSAQSSKIEMKQQEELVKIEAEMEQQKNKEKDAKKIADVARHKYNSSNSIGEGFSFSPMFTEIITEIDNLDNLTTLQRQKTMLRQKYAATSEDTPETRQYKQEQLRIANREIQIKMQAVRSRNKYSDNVRKKEEEEQSDSKNNDKFTTSDGEI